MDWSLSSGQARAAVPWMASQTEISQRYVAAAVASRVVDPACSTCRSSSSLVIGRWPAAAAASLLALHGPRRFFPGASDRPTMQLVVSLHTAISTAAGCPKAVRDRNVTSQSSGHTHSRPRTTHAYTHASTAISDSLTTGTQSNAMQPHDMAPTLKLHRTCMGSIRSSPSGGGLHSVCSMGS